MNIGVLKKNIIAKKHKTDPINNKLGSNRPDCLIPILEIILQVNIEKINSPVFMTQNKYPTIAVVSIPYNFEKFLTEIK